MTYELRASDEFSGGFMVMVLSDTGIVLCEVHFSGPHAEALAQEYFALKYTGAMGAAS